MENFQRLISNYPGSAQVADAQYYLAEAYFGMEDHVNAVYEYQRVFDLYPHSQWADEAQFKIGESWFEQRRRPELDQTETHEALLAYRRFIEDNPDSPHVDTARERIAQCRNRLAKKDYLSARLYLRQDHLEAARMSFEQMVRAYPDTDWYLWGISKLGEVDCRQGDRHSAHSRWNEVLELSDDEQLRERVQERLAETDCFD